MVRLYGTLPAAVLAVVAFVGAALVSMGIYAILMTAYWNTSTSAIVSWEQPAGIGQTCLLRYYGAEWPAGICWHDLPAGPMSVELPGQLTHPAYQPAHGDRYELRYNGEVVGVATLGESVVYETYLALVMWTAPPEPPEPPSYTIYLAAIRR